MIVPLPPDERLFEILSAQQLQDALKRCVRSCCTIPLQHLHSLMHSLPHAARYYRFWDEQTNGGYQKLVHDGVGSASHVLHAAWLKCCAERGLMGEEQCDAKREQEAAMVPSLLSDQRWQCQPQLWKVPQQMCQAIPQLWAHCQQLWQVGLMKLVLHPEVPGERRPVLCQLADQSQHLALMTML